MMLRVLVFTFLFLFCFCEDQGVEVIGEEDGVLVLDERNFRDALKTYPLLMVEFYAPWCKHCQRLAPEYTAAANTLKENGVPAKLAKVDAIQNKALAKKEGLKGYPLIKWYRGGVDTDFYKYGREKETLVEWVTRKSAPSTVDLDSVEVAKTFIDENNVAIIGFFKNKYCDEEKIFKRVGYSLEDAKLGVTNSDELFKHFKIDQESTVMLFKKFEETQLELEEVLNFESLKQFIKLNSTPHVVKYTEEEWKTIFHGKYSKHFFLWINEKDEENKEVLAAMRTVAKEFKDDIMFVLIATDEVDHKLLSNFFAIDNSEIPTFRLSNTKTENIFKYKPQNHDLTEENFRNFVTQFMTGILKPDLKTQEIPKDWDKRELMELVGSNFAQVALNKARYVFVYFYSPTCGEPCEKLGPVIEQLAEKMKKRHNVVIAQMNGAENEIEMFKIRSYPSLKLFKTGDNTVVEFKGKENTLGAFEEFLELNCRVNVRNSNSLRDRKGNHVKPVEEKPQKKSVRDEL